MFVHWPLYAARPLPNSFYHNVNDLLTSFAGFPRGSTSPATLDFLLTLWRVCSLAPTDVCGCRPLRGDLRAPYRRVWLSTATRRSSRPLPMCVVVERYAAIFAPPTDVCGCRPLRGDLRALYRRVWLSTATRRSSRPLPTCVVVDRYAAIFAPPTDVCGCRPLRGDDWPTSRFPHLSLQLEKQKNACCHLANDLRNSV